MVEAMQAVMANGIGRVTHGVKPGPATTLTKDEEAALVEYDKDVCSKGFPMTKRICKAYAWAIARRSGKHLSFNGEKGPSEKWWSGFRKRNPNLALRKADSIDRGRAHMANVTVCNEYLCWIILFKN